MRIVQKFGGTSVANTERIRIVADKVAAAYRAGDEVAVVVSAMSGVTNQLVSYCEDLSPLMTREAMAEYDVVVASGEQITSGLLALRLQELGIPARSWLGWQLPIRSGPSHGKARIREIKTDEVSQSLKSGMVAVVPGFQGLSPENRVSTLGRGGSDTSAVALAAALHADRCDIYTDVDGVYTCDPRIVPRAHKLDRITYEEMLEMASLGAKVLQTRSVEMAMNHGVQVQVLSSFEDKPGTLLVDEEEIVEQRKITGLAYSRDEARITLNDVKDKPGVSAAIFGALAEAEINVDMIVQNVTDDGTRTDVTFTVPRADMKKAIEVLNGQQEAIGFSQLHSDDKVAKISAIGVGMRSNTGIARQMFKTLAEKGINIIVISTSEIKISVLIAEEYVELALRALHSAYDLDSLTTA